MVNDVPLVSVSARVKIWSSVGHAPRREHIAHGRNTPRTPPASRLSKRSVAERQGQILGQAERQQIVKYRWNIIVMMTYKSGGRMGSCGLILARLARLKCTQTQFTEQLRKLRVDTYS